MFGERSGRAIQMFRQYFDSLVLLMLVAYFDPVAVILHQIPMWTALKRRKNTGDVG